jgi:hypothetical protein
MRFVPTKSVDQLDLQAMHRVHSRLVGQRTAIVTRSGLFCSSAASRRWVPLELA